ncbi:restriction endonuclease subunit S [Sulfuricurvum sp.]|uniref:restriction endonuclease subunit S n=1 Tax=Sulfuricurvum sp. TaxID=2025608 RepID=UPI002D29F57E|nr:restriction endonuclease subunit S [Sulfuricurvum sp.]HZF70941.1 restriction endonuclease subunit S [Sulfuricurvum sp.]
MCNIPKLRFKEFSGEWVEKNLGDVGKVTMCKRIMKDQTLPSGDIPFYKIGTFGKVADAYIDLELYQNFKTKYSYPNKGDILIAASGATYGKTVEFDGSPSYFQDSNIVWIANDEKLVYNSFLNYIYKRIKWTIEESTIPRLYNGVISSTSIKIPIQPEQHKIASFLSAVDVKIDQLTRKKELLEQYKKGVMQKIFSQKLRFKADDGSEFSEWEEKKISQIFEITRGNVLAVPMMSQEKKDDFQYPVYSSQTKNNGLTGYYNEYLFEDCITWTTDGANAGDANLRRGKFYCTNVCGVLKSDKGYANQCIAEILNTVTKKYVSYVGNPKLMNNTMGGIKITIPSSIDEQTKIANFLSAIDTKINLVTKQLDEAKNFKKGLLQQMFV